ncbi:conserved protein of unknown function [Shewanella benthica]|uniref:Uncharacterized protein n=1 Tax=Shewanella benthica TaxID=43661 RepID=A0A330M008_9GAMM|nr:hypothetical protein [Shewanella benthica]SQH75228.1 conserved protein of unknown function [Shewanella benthica]
MSLTWIELADTALKIGMGTLITAASGYLMLKRNQSHELEKERRARFYDLQAQKKKIYVEFLSKSDALVQSYLFSSHNGNSEEYKDYLTTFNEAQIMSDDNIRTAAYSVRDSVGFFITCNKTSPNLSDSSDSIFLSDLKAYRNDVNQKLGLFQKLAQLEVVREYEQA